MAVGPPNPKCRQARTRHRQQHPRPSEPGVLGQSRPGSPAISWNTPARCLASRPGGPAADPGTHVVRLATLAVRRIRRRRLRGPAVALLGLACLPTFLAAGAVGRPAPVLHQPADDHHASSSKRSEHAPTVPPPRSSSRTRRRRRRSPASRHEPTPRSASLGVAELSQSRVRLCGTPSGPDGPQEQPLESDEAPWKVACITRRTGVPCRCEKLRARAQRQDELRRLVGYGPSG